MSRLTWEAANWSYQKLAKWNRHPWLTSAGQCRKQKPEGHLGGSVG